MFLTGVALAGEVGHLHQLQILGVHQQFLQILMVLLFLHIILVAALHQAVALVDHQLLVATDTSLLLLHGAQILGHHQLLGC